MKTKKTYIFLFMILMVMNLGGCNIMDENMKSIEGKEGVFAIMKTSKGDIVLDLFYKKTPLTVTNFVGLAEGTLDAAKNVPFYDGLQFHRVINDFMIQGGDPEGTGRGGPGYKFADEIVEEFVFDKPGKLAMANAGAGTNGSQFFITHVPTAWLNGKHTIYGEVLTGQNIVNKIEQGDKIKKITIIRQGKEAEAFTCKQGDFDALAKKVEGKVAAAKEKEALRFIESIKKQFPNAKQDESGIFYVITTSGKKGKTGTGKKVSVEYKGYFLDNNVFDTSKGRAPLEFTTNAGEMIPGFDLMVQDMELGEKRTIIVPPDLAYGTNGIPGAIPGNTYICFDLELVQR
ncbi:MAG TPA: peptidylprolyl isomerase [Treponemataceae bacterium]|nr:peptidylprolyl isomerase [Treponemataceae bacterium]